MTLPVQRIEAVGGNVLFKPVGDAKDGIEQLVSGDQFVELNPQNAGRENSFVQQIGDELQLDGGLAHLARSADRHDGRYVGIEASPYPGHQVAAGGRNPCGGLVRPPRVETVKVGDKLWWDVS